MIYTCLKKTIHILNMRLQMWSHVPWENKQQQKTTQNPHNKWKQTDKQTKTVLNIVYLVISLFTKSLVYRHWLKIYKNFHGIRDIFSVQVVSEVYPIQLSITAFCFNKSRYLAFLKSPDTNTTPFPCIALPDLTPTWPALPSLFLPIPQLVIPL